LSDCVAILQPLLQLGDALVGALQADLQAQALLELDEFRTGPTDGGFHPGDGELDRPAERVR
jgi:hypothetical protein